MQLSVDIFLTFKSKCLKKNEMFCLFVHFLHMAFEIKNKPLQNRFRNVFSTEKCSKNLMILFDSV